MSKVNDLDKQIAVLQEKYQNDNSKKLDLEKKLTSETSTNHDHIKKLKENFAFEKKNLTKEIEKLRVKSYEQELELVECQANYDKDMALWQGKADFLDQQREQLKTELNESTKNFDMMFKKLKEHRVADKEEAESVKNAEVIALEQRFLNDIADLKEQQRQNIHDYDEQIRKLEKENKKQKENLHNSDFATSEDAAMLKRKYQEAQSNERSIQDEMQLMRKDHENQILELQRKMDQEKETIRMKLFENEQRLKESENKRQMFTFELEKEKTRWNIEKDRLISKQNEFLEKIDKYEKKNQFLVRDNDKLKNDLKSMKKNNQNSLMNIMGGGGGLGFKKSDPFQTERSFASKNDLGKSDSNNYDFH